MKFRIGHWRHAARLLYDSINEAGKSVTGAGYTDVSEQ